MSTTTAAGRMLDAALDHAEHGTPVFPTWWINIDGRCACGNPDCQRAGKHPIGALVPHGHLEATTDHALIGKWWRRYPLANIATPATWCTVLDVDPRHGGDTALAELERQYGALPDTPQVLTGGGGTHYYFRQADGVRCNNDSSVGAGLDIKSTGPNGKTGYTMLPPSNHVSGREYCDEIMHPMYETPLAPMPSWLTALATSTNGQTAPSAPVDWAARLAGAPEGQRHHVAVAIAGHLLGKGLTSAEVEAILIGFAERCSPPYDRADVRRIVHDLAAKDAAKAAPITSTADEISRVDFPLYDAADEWDFPPTEFTIERLLPAFGVVWWGGLPKRFKSLMLLYLSLAIACERPTLIGKLAILRRPKILYVAREDGGSRLKDRRDDITGAWGVRPRRGRIRFLIRPRFDLLNAAHVAWLRDVCRSEGITLLVLDTWTGSLRPPTRWALASKHGSPKSSCGSLRTSAAPSWSWTTVARIAPMGRP